jgi:tetratricopeptide (TPR) repeat protein
MSTRSRKDSRKRPGSSERAAIQSALRLGLVFLLVLAFPACQSAPALAFKGARHYAAGNEALERGDGELAISELQRAAELVPHGSEIQNHLGLAYLSVGQTGRAGEAFEAALALDCENEAARLNLAGLGNAKALESIPGESEPTIQRARDRLASEQEEADGSESHGG